MKTSTLLISLLLLEINLFCQGVKDAHFIKTKVDTTIILNYDVDYDRIPDKLIFNFKAESLSSPFIWTFEIYSMNKKIFGYIRDDKRTDKFFIDTNYVTRCRNYVECKKKFYFHDLPWLYSKSGIPQRIDNSYLEFAIKPILQDSLRLNNILKNKVLKEFRERMNSNSLIVLPIYATPVVIDYAITYSTTLKRMIKAPWAD